MSRVIFNIRKNTYYDSVKLMLISKDVKKIEGVHEALVGMGTDLNKELAENLDLISPEIEELGPNDFFITVLADESVEINTVVDEADRLLNQKGSDSQSDYMPPNLNSALEHSPDSNIALISVAGEYAADEARNALNKGLHVMIFSDNVKIEDERELKELALSKGLLMMGPDCGTAIINNIPLAFANVIRKGKIGIVGASGTGIQETTVLIHKLGEGVSQVIGTGGRDLSLEVGGLMMLQSLEALVEDPDTEVILLISKPPAKEIEEKILAKVKEIKKPVVVSFIGGEKELIEKNGGVSAISLEDAARKSVALLRGEAVEDFDGFTMTIDQVEKLVNDETAKLGKEQKYLRGMYTGGTLADECMKLLSPVIGDMYSNIPLKPEYKLKDVFKSQEHTCVDFGDDDFTKGRPHPMIDPSIRMEQLEVEAKDENIALVLMDFILGYGSHPDPVGEMIPAIIDAKAEKVKKGQHLIVVASVCGTENDPQDLIQSEKKLKDAGVIVMPSNAQAVRLAGLMINKIGKKEDL
jgi:succinyl-CoA synthetase alpha subunit